MDPKYRKRIIKQETLVSQYLGYKKEFLVYLPPDYTRDGNYPLLLLHDGDDYLKLGRIATMANQFIQDDYIAPLIIVMVPVVKKKRNREYDPSGNHHHLHRKFIIHEVLPFLEKEYSIDQSPDQRIIGGSSLGATASLHISLDNPESFSNVLSQSGAFYQETLQRLNDIQSAHHLTIYQSIGKAETNVPTNRGTINLIEFNDKVHLQLIKKGAKVHYSKREGDHTWGLWQKDLAHALLFFFSSE